VWHIDLLRLSSKPSSSAGVFIAARLTCYDGRASSDVSLGQVIRQPVHVNCCNLPQAVSNNNADGRIEEQRLLMIDTFRHAGRVCLRRLSGATVRVDVVDEVGMVMSGSVDLTCMTCRALHRAIAR